MGEDVEAESGQPVARRVEEAQVLECAAREDDQLGVARFDAGRRRAGSDALVKAGGGLPLVGRPARSSLQQIETSAVRRRSATGRARERSPASRTSSIAAWPS